MLTFGASDEGAAQLLAWSKRHGSPMTAGVQGTGSYGYQFTRSLQAAGLTVVEVNRPRPREPTTQGKERSSGCGSSRSCCPGWEGDRSPQEPRRSRGIPTFIDDRVQQRRQGDDDRSNQIKAILVGAGQ
jgi:hypothetical protein